MIKRFILSVAGVVLLANGLVLTSSAASNSTRIITPAHMSGWFFYDDQTDTINNGLGSFVEGPDQPPAGDDSVQIRVSGDQRRNLATYRFADTKLTKITDLKYSTYNAQSTNGDGAGSQRSGYLQFNVSFNGADTWQRRLVFLPSDNTTFTQDDWKEWDAIKGGNALWRYSGPTWPGSGEAGTQPKTWSAILAQYPDAQVRKTDAFMGVRVGEPYANGYTENIDKFVFGTEGNLKTFDFERNNVPSSKDDCKKDAWEDMTTAGGREFKNQGECVSYIAKDKNSDQQ